MEQQGGSVFPRCLSKLIPERRDNQQYPHYATTCTQRIHNATAPQRDAWVIEATGSHIGYNGTGQADSRKLPRRERSDVGSNVHVVLLTINHNQLCQLPCLVTRKVAGHLRAVDVWSNALVEWVDVASTYLSKSVPVSSCIGDIMSSVRWCGGGRRSFTARGTRVACRRLSVVPTGSLMLLGDAYSDAPMTCKVVCMLHTS